MDDVRSPTEYTDAGFPKCEDPHRYLDTYPVLTTTNLKLRRVAPQQASC